MSATNDESELRSRLAALMHTPRQAPGYRDACVEAIGLAAPAGHLDFGLESFLSQFASSPPESPREAEALCALASLYEAHDFPDSARDLYLAVRSAFPSAPGIRTRLAAVGTGDRGTGAGRRSSGSASAPNALPGLPDLPDLPGLPGLPDLPDLPGLPDVPPPPAPSPRPAATAPRAASGSPSNTGMFPGAAIRKSASASFQTVGRGDRRSDSTPAVPAGRAPTMQPDGGDGWAAFPDEPTAPRATIGNGASSPTGPTGTSFTPPPGFTGFVPGMVLADRYRLDRQVGEGGMAVVFESWDLELDETIALKIFTRELANERSLARFKQEISLSRRIAHPNVVRLYDFGSWHGFRFISMELLEGRDLNSWMGAPIAHERGIRWLAQAADGLQAAHDRGVIHRDIKPHNIFICRDDTVKVMDFGIAKRGTGDGVTQGNMLAGTPDYMSPEQISGFSTVTHTTDLYALGVVAYQMFTGTLPFTHEELVPLLMMHINDPVPPPRERNPLLRPDLERVILRLLEKKPEDRYPSCAALAEALRSLPPSHP